MRDLKVKGGKNMEISSDQLNSILRERRRGERKRVCGSDLQKMSEAKEKQTQKWGHKSGRGMKCRRQKRWCGGGGENI